MLDVLARGVRYAGLVRCGALTVGPDAAPAAIAGPGRASARDRRPCVGLAASAGGTGSTGNTDAGVGDATAVASVLAESGAAGACDGGV